MKKTALSLCTAAVLAMSLSTSSIASSGFVDVDDNSPFTLFINDLQARGISNGIGDGKFAPNDQVTRAEFAKFLIVTFKVGTSTGSVPFNDVQGHWGHDYIVSAYTNGIIKGTSENTFEPDSKVTREEAATMIWRYLSAKGVTPTASSVSLKENPQDWAQDGVKNVIGLNLFGPEVSNNSGVYDYQPHRGMSRQEMAAMLSKSIPVNVAVTGKVVNDRIGTRQSPVTPVEGTIMKIFYQGSPSRTTMITGILNPTKEANNLIPQSDANTYKFGNIPIIFVKNDNGNPLGDQWCDRMNPYFIMAPNIVANLKISYNGSDSVTFTFPNNSNSPLTWKYKDGDTIKLVTNNTLTIPNMNLSLNSSTIYLDTTSDTRLVSPAAWLTIRNNSQDGKTVQLSGIYSTSDIN